MQKRLVALEEQYQREKEEVQKEFDKERKVRNIYIVFVAMQYSFGLHMAF